VIVTLSNTTAEVEFDHRRHGREEQLRAASSRCHRRPRRCRSWSPATSCNRRDDDIPRQWNAGDVRQSGDQRVHVKGQTSGAALMARQIEIQNTNVDLGVT
jgi:hypothetical protein